jgi:hypothetical protein
MMTYKSTLTDEQIASWKKLMLESPDNINEMMVKRPMVAPKKKRRQTL